MHIPDGYISPQTFIPSYFGIIALSAYGLKKIKKQIQSASIPLIATISALSFVIMMINIPIPGGTTGHAIGTAVLALFFGPWVGFLAMSMVLFIQAVFFGDGGITAFAINAFSMEFLASFSAYISFALLKKVSKTSIAAFFSGWISIVAASVSTAFFLGIQPTLACDTQGLPLYFPFGLSVTFPAIVLSHILILGPVEGFFTTLILKNFQPVPYLQQTASINKYPNTKKSLVVLILFLLVVPIGLISGAPAWGEWEISYFKSFLRFIPEGINKFSALYIAPFTDYSIKNLQGIFGYYLSAIIGIILISGGIASFLIWKRRHNINKDTAYFLGYLVFALAVSVTSNLWILTSCLSLLLIVGVLKRHSEILKFSLLALILFNGSVTIAYLLFNRAYHPIIIFNVRALTLTYSTLLMAKTINLFSVASFSKTISMLLTISYSQILIFKKTFNEFQLAFKSRAIQKPMRSEINLFIIAVVRFFLSKALYYSKEINLAMKSRGFDVD